MTTSLTPQDSVLSPASSHLPLYRYTKFRSLGVASPVIQILNHLRGVLSLLNSSINFNCRRGLLNMSLNELLLPDDLIAGNFTCMTLPYASSNDLIVGGTHSLSKVDLNKPSKMMNFNHQGDLSFINYTSKLVTLGKYKGSLDIFDPLSNLTVKSFAGHNGLLSDLDVRGNYVATCGYSMRSKRPNASLNSTANSLEYLLDPLVNIYDLRMMRALPPVPFSAGASFAKFHPKLPNIIVVASTGGQLQFVDMFDQLESHIYQADLSPSLPSSSMSTPTSSYLFNLDMSENGEFLCFSDGYKNLHLWSMDKFSPSNNFVNFPATLEQPDISEASMVSDARGFDHDMPLNAVGMPYYKEYLCSNLPSDMIFVKETARVPPVLSSNFPPKNGVDKKVALKLLLSYDKTRYGDRYVVEEFESLRVNTHQKKGRNKTSTAKTLIPKFLSERSASFPVPSNANIDSPSMPSLSAFNDSNDYNDNAADRNSAYPHEELVFQSKSTNGHKPPTCYTKLEIHYSKFGVDDFDFDYYNHLSGLFAGLENHLDNSYANSLLQLYRFIPIFYNTTTKSLLNEYLPNDKTTIQMRQNPQGSSVLNELAYLFDMMHNAGERNVNICNFSLILCENPTAKAHGLLNKDDGKSLDAADLQNLIVTFNKFLVESVINDYISQFGINIQDITATHYGLEFYNLQNGSLTEKQWSNQATVDLVTPPQSVGPKMNYSKTGQYHTQLARKNHTILTYLEHSLNQQKVIPPSKPTSAEIEVKQSLVQIGPVLLINCPLSEAEFELIRNYKKWLLPEFYALFSNHAKKVIFKPVVTQFNQRAEKYELQGYVCEVSHGPRSAKGQHNLVSYVRVKSPASGKYQWMLFNDFLVMPVTPEDVFDLSPPWKKPVVIVYSNVEDPRNQEFTYFHHETFRTFKRLDDSILFKDHFAYGIRNGYKKDYELLTRDEAPEPGSLVAIDAEFVSLRPEVAEVSYTGMRNLQRPTLLSLARISAIRGNPGPKHCVPFIDDYILHCKPIYDYLTTFSGIEPGDLDPETSTKTLVTLQTAYRRLWLLLNMGCVFVGHGLKSDFRCINLQVPRAQIRDTIEFYYLPDFKRKLSLKFLAYVVLKEAVQTRNHDSIEDATTALLLYEKYMELKAAGEFEGALKRIYSEGQLLRFRVPE